MGALEELNALLDRVPLWRQLVALPERIKTLEARLAAVEAQLAGRTGALCPMCNAPTFKRTGTRADPAMAFLGVTIDAFRCEACGHAEERSRTTRQD